MITHKRTWSVENGKLRAVTSNDRPTLDQFLPAWLKGHTAAIDFVLTLHEIVETWDDLIDEDSVTDKAVNAAMYAALVTLPRNLFYREHFTLLSPVIEAAVFDWLTANEFEGRREHLHTSYILRCAGLAVTVMCARIIGGPDWAIEVNNELRTMGDTWTEYAAKHGVT